MNSVVPENIHGGNWKFGGGGGSEAQEIPEGRGLDNKITLQGSISFRFRPEFEHCFLPT